MSETIRSGLQDLLTIEQLRLIRESSHNDRALLAELLKIRGRRFLGLELHSSDIGMLDSTSGSSHGFFFGGQVVETSLPMRPLAQINLSPIYSSLMGLALRGSLVIYLSTSYFTEGHEHKEPEKKGGFALIEQYRDDSVLGEVGRILSAFEGVMISANSDLSASEAADSMIARFNSAAITCPISILCSDSASLEACYKAAFHANGISYSRRRLHDPHYRHLLERAIDYRVFFRISELSTLLPSYVNQSEKRALYICVCREDLLRGDFRRAIPVLL